MAGQAPASVQASTTGSTNTAVDQAVLNGTNSVTATTSARASKTWVLPPRPKPGRKSKKVTEAAAQNKAVRESGDIDDAETSTISRVKQKASRERKQEYIVELETKLRAYQQGDGERASFFQNLAKKHSEENEALKAENESLRQTIAALQARLQQLSVSSPPESVKSSSTLTRKPSAEPKKSSAPRAKRRKTRSSSVSSSTSSTNAIFLPTSAPIDPMGHRQSYSPDPSTSQHGATMDLQQPAHALDSTAPSHHDATPSLSLSPASAYLPTSPSLSAVSTTTMSPLSGPGVSFTSSGCGLCDDKTGGGQCICEDIGIGRPGLPSQCDRGSKASCGLCVENGSMCICEDIGIGRPDAPSKLDSNLQSHGTYVAKTVKDEKPQIITPGSTGTVRLRTAKKGFATGQVWRLDNSTPSNPIPTTSPLPAPIPRSPAAAAGVALRRRLIKVGSRLPCSGDPRTCPACADDPAGQAFCSALSNTVCSTNPCASCPNRPSPLVNEIRMRSSTPTAITANDAVEERLSLRRRDSSARDEVPEAMIPCSDAWATLREHPNIGFANLDLLASVVAKRTVCSGEKRDAEGKIVEVGREGVEEALDMLDHVRDA